MIVSGCVNPPTYDIKPKIEFLSISRTLIDQLDSIRFEFSFTDGDGDLGFQNPDTAACNLCDSSCYDHATFSLFITDLRTNCLAPFEGIPYIPPKGSSDAISGKINVLLANICCISPEREVCIPMPNYPIDTIRYTVQIRDVAGNFSNIITLPPLVVRCDK